MRRFTWTRGLCDWIGSHTRTFAFIGGIPAMVVSNNLQLGHHQGPYLRPLSSADTFGWCRRLDSDRPWPRLRFQREHRQRARN
jgi:hypothetical protein